MTVVLWSGTLASSRVPPISADELLHDAHAEAGTRHVAGRVGAVEAFADPSQLFRRHADAVIADLEADGDRQRCRCVARAGAPERPLMLEYLYALDSRLRHHLQRLAAIDLHPSCSVGVQQFGCETAGWRHEVAQRLCEQVRKLEPFGHEIGAPSRLDACVGRATGR
ncbi:MAG: hypothetical protein V9G29_18495 [Burkholderiaceae bacterium]